VSVTLSPRMKARIDCGSLEFAHARILARHGQRVTEPAWQRIEVVRGFAPALEMARGTALRTWLVGLTADSTVGQIEAVLRGHGQAMVDEVAAWMPTHWQPALAWCARWPDLPVLQHLARGGELPPGLHDDELWVALEEQRGSATPLSAGPWSALAPAWAVPDRFGPTWLAEWQRLLPRGALTPGDPLARVLALWREHGLAFAQAVPGQGWPQRAALRARLALLLRSAALEPAEAFIHLTLCALDLERLRAELLRRACFPRWAAVA
jgi:hypothetical protein